MSWPEGITAWAVIATLIAVGWQSYETARSADIANRTLLSTMRPKLAVRCISIHRGTNIPTYGVPDADPWRVDCDVVNVGQSKACVIQYGFTIDRVSGRGQEFVAPNDQGVCFSLEPGQKKGISIGLNQQLTGILRLIGIDGLAQGCQDTNHLYFWGQMRYTDSLGILRHIAVRRHYKNDLARFEPSDDPDFEYAD